MFYDFKLIEFLVLFIHAFFFHLDHHTQTTVLYFFLKTQILVLWSLHFLSFVFVIFYSYMLLLFSSPLILKGSWIKWLAHLFNNFLEKSIESCNLVLKTALGLLNSDTNGIFSNQF